MKGLLRVSAVRVSRWAIVAGRFVIQGIGILAVAGVVLTAAYFISEPFDKFAQWYNANNIAPRALILVLGPIAAAVASQIKENLVQQGRRREPKSIRRALSQINGQQDEMLMEWVKWLTFAVSAIALSQIVGLF